MNRFVNVFVLSVLGGNTRRWNEGKKYGKCKIPPHTWKHTRRSIIAVSKCTRYINARRHLPSCFWVEVVGCIKFAACWTRSFTDFSFERSGFSSNIPLSCMKTNTKWSRIGCANERGEDRMGVCNIWSRVRRYEQQCQI